MNPPRKAVDRCERVSGDQGPTGFTSRDGRGFAHGPAGVWLMFLTPGRSYCTPAGLHSSGLSSAPAGGPQGVIVLAGASSRMVRLTWWPTYG